MRGRRYEQRNPFQQEEVTGWPSRLSLRRVSPEADRPSPDGVPGPGGGAPIFCGVSSAASSATRCGHLLGGYLTGTGNGLYPNVALSDSEDWPIVLGYVAGIIGWLAGLGVFNDILRQMAGPAAGARSRRTRGRRPGQVLQVHPRPQGGRASSTWSAMIIYFCTAGLFAMAIRTELLSPDVPRLQLRGLRRDRRRARHDDDDADDLGHPRAVRQLPGAAHDRLQAGGVPPDRGAVVLADPGAPSSSCCRACCSAASRSAGPATPRCRSRPRPGGLLRVAFGLMGISMILAGLQPHRHDHLLPGARACAGAGCRCSSGRCSPPRS